jgi:hypothetical protein
MQHAWRIDKVEIIEKFSMLIQRLRPHAGPSRNQIVLP